jgi:large subunit ribosomal protein L17
MRHRVAHRKLGRKSEHRLALLRNLCTSLITHERVITTLPKAKELRPFAERAITLGKRALGAEAPETALHHRRIAAGYFQAGNAARIPDGGYKRPQASRTAGVFALEKLFDEIATRYAQRPGGYTRILKLGRRRGDGAELALIELVGSEEKAAHEEEKKEEKKTRRFFGRKKKTEAGEEGAESPKRAKTAATKKTPTASKGGSNKQSEDVPSKSASRRKKKSDGE